MTKGPIKVGHQPKGFEDFKDGKGKFGIVGYPRELTTKELEKFGMRKWEEKDQFLESKEKKTQIDNLER